MSDRICPNFFLPGAARSGTTTLYHILKKHHDIYMPSCKEPNFFCDDDSYQKKITDYHEYLNLFKNAKKNQIIGDASVKYLYSKTAAYNINSKITNPKILIQLRNPVNRAISHYKWLKRSNLEPLNFKEALKNENKRIEQDWPYPYHYLNMGYYFQQVKRYIDIFGKENVKITLFEDFKMNPKEVIYIIFDFLQLDKELQDLQIKNFNSSNEPKFRKTRNFIKNNQALSKIIKNALPQNLKEQLSLKLMHNTKEEKNEVNLSNKEKEKLFKKFYSDIDKLEKLTEMDFSIWEKVHLNTET